MTNEITFRPATITRTDRNPIRSVMHWMLLLDENGTEWDEAVDGTLLIGVSANYDRVFTVGPYTITID